MLIRDKKGTKETQTVSVRVSNLIVGGNLLQRTIDNSWGNEFVCLKFKNHKKA